MYAVSISLGSTSAYVAVAPFTPPSDGVPSTTSLVASAAPIKVVANSGGHRHTPVAAALTEQEVLFGENAVHIFARQPQRVVPYLFSYSAAAAATADAAQAKSESATIMASNFLTVVERAARVKYQGHCSLEEREGSAGIQQHGYTYETDGADGDVVEKFASAEDLFVQFLNYVKAHSVDAACSLVAGADSAAAKRCVMLTVVVPRGAFPSAVGASGAHGSRRAEALEWLADAVRASQLGDVALHTSVLFSDEAALLAFDSAPRTPQQPRPYFLLPPSAARGPDEPASGGPVKEADVLVVDWGAVALHLTLHRTVGGVLAVPPEGSPFMSCATGADSASEAYYCGAFPCGGGDALDVSLADKVAANYVVVNRRVFQSMVPNMRSLSEFLSPSGVGSAAAASEARRIITETIPPRAMRRLRVLMGDKKVALNTNPQASSVAVEMEAFYEGMDLMDSQSLSRNKFEAAVQGEWGCVERFEAALAEFLRRHGATLGSRRISHVLLTGGMCQIPSIAAGLRRVLQSPRNAALQAALAGGSTVRATAAVEVMDTTLLGNGVAADELFAVGGCLHSYHLARVFADRDAAARRLARVQRKRKTAAGRIAAEAARDEQAALVATWAALTGVEEAAMDACAPAETAAHAFVLTRTVYLLTGDGDASLSSSLAAAQTNAATLPRASLTALFPQGSVLPARVACPIGEAAEDAVVYLFAELARGGDGAEEATVTVQPLPGGGVRVPAALDAAGHVFVVFTLRTDVDDDGHHMAAVVIQRVTSRSHALPTMLTPANSVVLAEVVVQ